MLNSKPVDKIIFFDIESVPEQESFFDMSPRKQRLFSEKFKKEWVELNLGNPARAIQEADPNNKVILEDAEADERAKIEALYNNKAALHAEYGKVVCISIGYISGGIPEDLSTLPAEQNILFKTRSFYGDDEKKLLSEFYETMKGVMEKIINPTHHLCGYNILNFDVPFLAKRMIINGVKLPAMINLDQKKEWNLPFLLDLRRTWQMNVYDGGCSLDMLCEVFNVPSPKEGGISGKDVRDVYYKEKNLKKIADYCALDVSQLCLCYLRIKGLQNNLETN